MVELCNVMHRQLLTQVGFSVPLEWCYLSTIEPNTGNLDICLLQDNTGTQAAVLQVVSHVLTAALESLAAERR